MMNLSRKQYLDIKNEEVAFSLIQDFRGDELTPIRIFNSISEKKKFILESAITASDNSRYSFIGFNPKADISSKDNFLEECYKYSTIKFRNETNPFPFKGGLIGAVSYDQLASYEKKLKMNNLDEIGTEDFRLYLFDDYICYDHYKSKVFIVRTINSDRSESYDEITKLNEELYKSFYKVTDNYSEIKEEKNNTKDFQCNYTKEEYLEKVEKAKEYIKAGDIFQVVFSQRFSVKTKKSALEIYRTLRETNPSPYLYYIDFDDYEIIGASPESLVAVIDRKVITNPIAGTRKRGVTEEEDKLLEEELLADEKERAEHLMLVDLGRNDIGKVSKIGTVEVLDFMKIERYSHVMHITSKVKGELREELSSLDALISCIPAGTLSGAPKIRAMEIIEELENRKRGYYGGAIGYFSYGGNMDMAITIRTTVLKDGIAYIQAGGGLVYDSQGEFEYEETLNKSRVLREAVL